MADEEQLQIVKSSVWKWNAWRKGNPETQVNLSGANLRYADLSGADLSRANLSFAHLSGAHLSGAHLSRANLSHADLSGAHLSGAHLRGADLSGADLSGADLSGADLSSAVLLETVFANVNLSSVIGLESCEHRGPSTLDYHSLMQSGTLPLPFLRGCGLPDALIDYLPSLLGTAAIQFYSCFISYSTEDKDFAERLHADLQNKGVRCWFAPHDIQAGKKIHEQIDVAIRVYDRLLLILSDDSMKSNWVKTEIDYAMQKERKEGRKVLFPVSIVPFKEIEKWRNFNADIGMDLAKEIREYFMPDFSNWKDHDSYSKAFERLLRDLKAEKSASAVVK